MKQIRVTVTVSPSYATIEVGSDGANTCSSDIHLGAIRGLDAAPDKPGTGRELAFAHALFVVKAVGLPPVVATSIADLVMELVNSNGKPETNQRPKMERENEHQG